MGRKVLTLGHGIYASNNYLKKKRNTDQLIVWEHERKTPEWVKNHYPDGRIAIRANEIMTMMEAVKHHQGLARLPCYVADKEPTLRRLDLNLTPSQWGIWVLSHVDLRSTARVRVCREFLVDIIQQQKELIEGLSSHYY